MSLHSKPLIAVVDYGMGNLFSIQNACRETGLQALVTRRHSELADADAIILPGVGAFGDAMQALKQRDLIRPLQEAAASGKILFGICLGMQLLMTESHEFGLHRGLDIVPGTVIRFNGLSGNGKPPLKVPQVGWNRIFQDGGNESGWKNTPLEKVADGAYMYFVHSYYVIPEHAEVRLSKTRYGDHQFCSSLRYGNVFGCQFHPERSGPAGLEIYRGLMNGINRIQPEKE